MTGQPDSRPEQVEAPARKDKTGRQASRTSRTFSAHLNGYAPSTHPLRAKLCGCPIAKREHLPRLT